MTNHFVSQHLVQAPDDPSEMIDYLDQMGNGDGLPVIPPTPERVRRFLADWEREGTEVIAALPPEQGVLTAEKLAVNAILAGCRSSYLPILASAVSAICSPDFNLNTIQITSNPATVLIIVNGPIRNGVNINFGANCMGHGTRANVTIGRALRLIMQNVGGSAIGSVDMACQGFPGKISFCFGENEEASPWDPFHVGRGFSPEDSAVTVVAAQGTSNIIVHGRLNADDLLPTLANGMINPGANNFCVTAGQPLLVLNPGHAHALYSDGITRSALQEYLYANARVAVGWYPARAQEASNMDGRAINGMLPVAASPDDIMIVVAGEAGSHSTFVPTYGETTATTELVDLR